jgi:Flp pilus assembly pilin Flp
MSTKRKTAISRLREELAQDMVEYALIMGLVSVVAVGAVIALGGTIQAYWDMLSTSLPDL